MIPQIKKILYATDLSKNSVYAFRYAVEMAEKYDAEIIILHVIEPIPSAARHYMKIYVDEAKWEEKIKYEQDVAIERIKKRITGILQAGNAERLLNASPGFRTSLSARDIPLRRS